MKIKHNINIKRDLHYFIFTQLNELRRWGLTPSDVKILSALYNKDYELKVINGVGNFKDRMTILFSKETKDEIISNLKISYNAFNNSLTKLRKKGSIESDNSLNEKLLFDLGKETFSFILEFQNEEKC